MNILPPRNLDSGNVETGIPEQKSPLIGLITINKKLSECQVRSRFARCSRLCIGEISYILYNCQLVS